jgi:hypothetical protein
LRRIAGSRLEATTFDAFGYLSPKAAMSVTAK